MTWQSSNDPMTLMVTRVEPDAYVTDTNSRPIAALDSEIDISYIGPVTKAALSGQQGNRLIRYFQFPLEPGREWSTDWDQSTRTVTARGASGDEFELEATENGVVRAKYTYHRLAGFFGRIEFFTSQGQPIFALRLLDHGENYTGSYVRAETKNVFPPVTRQDQPSLNENRDFTIASGTHELLLRYTLRCAQPGSWSVLVKPQDAQQAQQGGHENHGTCPGTTPWTNLTFQNPWVGPWRLSWNAAFVVGPNAFTGMLLTRTYEEFAYS